MTEKEDVRKFDKWVGEWDRNNGKGLLSHPRLVNAFLAGLKAGREEWEEKVKELRKMLALLPPKYYWDVMEKTDSIFGEPAKSLGGSYHSQDAKRQGLNIIHATSQLCFLPLRTQKANRNKGGGSEWH